MKQDKKDMNKGIQARIITAEVIAVGDNAYAVKGIANTSHNEFLKVISGFREAIDELNLDGNARGAVEEDIKKLEGAAKKENLDKVEIGGILQSISGKLKMVGVIMTETASLMEPIKKVADFLGTTLKSLGLFA